MVQIEKDKLLQLIIDTYPGLMAYVDKNERYQYINNAYSEWFDQSVLGKTVQDVIKEFYPQRKDFIHQALSGKKVVFEAPIHHKDKGVIYTETSYTPHMNTEGVVEGFVIIVTDVSHQQKSDIYSLLIHAPVSVVLMTGPNHKVELINHMAKRSIGNQDITGKPLEEAVPGLKNTEVMEKIHQVYVTGQPSHVNAWPISWLNDDGTIDQRYFDLIYHPWKDFYGKMIGVLHMGVDVTDKLASEVKFRTYSESMPQMAFMADVNGDITYYNQRWFDYTGMDKTQGYGWNWQPVQHPDDLQKTVASWTHSLKTGETYEIEYRLRRHDGVYRWHLGRAVPARNDSGKIMGWLGTNTDIHDQKETEAQLERALKTRDEFLSVASHELRTPITSLKLQSQMITRGLARGDQRFLTAEKVQQYANQTNDTVNRLSRLINDMMDVSKISAGRLLLEKSDTDLGVMVNEVVGRLEGQFYEAKIPKPIVTVSSEIHGMWDRFRIEQVLINLLTNGIRYGKGKPLEVRVWKEKERAFFSVKDSGIGVIEKDLERIFGRFERGIDPSEVSGMGLGLYISRQLINAHEGHIRVDSTFGVGSTFTVELPL